MSGARAKRAISNVCLDRWLALTALVVLVSVLASSCRELGPPPVEPFVSTTTPPPQQELRWSNGSAPRSMDPAKAASAPETDIVRAVYEGLTSLDATSLKETPGAAESWESSPDHRIWTFRLRPDARWTNGQRVTAHDFVNSWLRLKAFKEKAAHQHLVHNIVGMQQPLAEDPSDFISEVSADTIFSGASVANSGMGAGAQLEVQIPSAGATPAPPQTESQFGVSAIDDRTLRVSLSLPDPDFPKLVAHPVFRPVFDRGAGLEQDLPNVAVVTNGAFKIIDVGDDGVLLERSDSYWNRRSVGLERVRMVPVKSAEAALSAYKNGEIDVVTNASFEPLALKLLAPYEDFKRSLHSALNFYEFNTERWPFDDRRVREAFAIAIDRTKLTEGELQGVTAPATSLSPFTDNRKEALSFDSVRARDLLEKAGFPNGHGLPVVRLVINRNEMQQRIARSIARMWKQHLNVEVDIVVQESNAMADVRKSGDFDLIRRGVVLPTNDRLVNLVSILGSAEKKISVPVPEPGPTRPEREDAETQKPVGSTQDLGPEDSREADEVVLSDADIAYDVSLIPLYFPVSYCLIKPYVRGFELNSLDSISLKDVSIDSEWRPQPTK